MIQQRLTEKSEVMGDVMIMRDCHHTTLHHHSPVAKQSDPQDSICQPPVQKKRFHTKTRTGCIRCKQRKIKCDEAQPECQRCRKSGFKCLGYNVPQPRIFELQAKPKFENEVEKGAFDYFVLEGADILTAYNPPTRLFWLQNAPQLAEQSPAVRHGLIALGLVQSPLHRSSSQQLLSKTRTQMPIEALSNLSKAMKLLSSMDASSVSTELSLACSMIFTTVALWVDKNAAPIIHIDAVRKIMRDYIKAVRENPMLRSALVDQLWLPNYKNMIVNAIAFMDAYPPKGSDLQPNWALEFGLDRAGSFGSIGDAFDALNNIIRCIVRMNTGHRMKGISERVRSALGVFVKSLDGMRPSTSTKDGHAENDYRSLKVHHRVAIVMLQGLGSGDETGFDHHCRDFSHIVTECEELLQDQHDIRVLKTSLGLLPPLFFTATKCRNGVIRRKALQVLHSASRNEVPWTSCVAYQLAKFVIETEGQGEGDLAEQRSVPAFRRIRLRSVKFSKEEGKMYVQYWRYLDRDEPESCRATLPFVSHASIEKDGATLQMEQKVLQAYGYVSIMFITPPIICHCPSDVRRAPAEEG